MKHEPELNTDYQGTQHFILETTFSNADLKQDYLSCIQSVLDRAESAERELSYVSICGSEQARKELGSYYTPVDVARFFWSEFFDLSRVEGTKSAEALIRRNDFVEPSVGAGALFFALLEKFIRIGVSPSVLSEIRVDLVDINKHALSFVKQSLLELEVSWNVKFERVRFVCGDFLRGNLEILNRPVVFFGNPPFVTNKVGHSKWKNSFADFLELALETCGTDGAVHFIVPISIAFSRDYKKLRQMLVDRGGLVALSNFDNIPDTLFKSGKPLHKNTNKSNSQRCSLISVLPAKKPSVMSTQLHRWSKKGRKNLLETRPRYYDVSDFLTEGQFIRPKSSAFLNYYRNAVGQSVLGGMESPRGKHELNVASVARNFIGIRDVGDQASQSLSFESEHDFLRAFIIITSDVFMDYWLSIGDGFHLTRSNLVGFPVDDRLQNRIDKLIPQARRVWTVREHFAKEKLNSGAFTRSFDFSNVFPSLYEAA